MHTLHDGTSYGCATLMVIIKPVSVRTAPIRAEDSTVVGVAIFSDVA